jgi:hypothetical protein
MPVPPAKFSGPQTPGPFAETGIVKLLANKIVVAAETRAVRRLIFMGRKYLDLICKVHNHGYKKPAE